MARLHRNLLLLALCLGLLLTWANVTPGRAAAAAPLYLELGDGATGDIFSYTSAGFKNLTGYGYNAQPVLSPDGKYIAYGSYAKEYLQEGGRSGAPSTNIWLMETTNGNARRIAEQPPDNRAAGDTRVRPFAARTDPVWSPDGQSLAWLEDVEGTHTTEEDQNDHLFVYSLAAKKSVEIYKQPIFAAGCPCSAVTWTAQGISLVSATNPSGPFKLRVLDVTGKILTEIPGDTFPQYQWLTGETSPAMVTDKELITFTTLQKFDRSATLPPIEITSASAPAGIRFRSDAGYFGAHWTILTPDGKSIQIGKISEAAISPDGTRAAYITDSDSTLYYFDGSTAKELDLSAIKVRNITSMQARGLAWSPLALQIGQ